MENSICVITSVRNCLFETAEYLESLKRFPPKNLSEQIIIDDGSEEETQKFLLSKKEEYTLYRNRESMGFAYANNLGGAKAAADWLLFMNNDLVLSRGWSDSFNSLILDRESNKNLGCAGNIQLDPDTRKIDHAGVVFSNGIPEHFCKGKQVAPANYQSEYLAVTGACFLIKRELFLSVGGFDESYKTGFEDIDLCLRLSMLGYKNVVLNQSVVLHKKSSTPERNQFQSHNSRVFYDRWGKVITRFQEWENAKRKLENCPENKKTKVLHAFEYVLNRKESFLFADRKILLEYFNLYLKQKNFPFSERILSILVDRYDFDEKTIFCKARFFAAKEKYSEAKIILEGFLKENPKNVEVLLLLSSAYQKEGVFQYQ